MLRTLSLVVGGVILTTASLGVNAQDVKQRNLRFAYSVAPDHPFAVGAKKFGDLVAQKSDGKIKIQLFANAILGSDPQNLSAVRGGTLDFTSLAYGLVASVDKKQSVYDLPFLFNNAEEAYAIADGPIGRRLDEGLAEHGLISLGLWDLGFRHMTNSKHPITKAEDIQGLKLRVIASPIYVDLFNTLGANPVPMTFGELYGALESRTVDGQDNPIGVIAASRLQEVQKYLSLTRHLYTGMPLLMSKKTWDGMSDTERAIIRDAAQEAKIFQRETSQAAEAKTLEALKDELKVNAVSDEEIERLREKVKPVVAKHSQEVGAELYNEVVEELTRIRSGK
ncbi:TRAP transporter substrate-binding protein [Lampropedia puyangensis]|uniref:TRAP transporter substrate-binding protein n=2 Tax=Lampropedia puyangensis TaxID=1330072 RepID=A0A4S8F086_9BURK|nr:TRAP transporter substrate-binding protein [Lampropedia puyangensis]